MITKEMYFYSNGYKLKAALYLPDGCEEGEKLPCIIPNSGYMGLNEIYPALYARALTAMGCAAFGFDYRGFLDNGGPAGVCKLEEQVEDIRNAGLINQTGKQTAPVCVNGGGLESSALISFPRKSHRFRSGPAQCAQCFE